MYTCCNNNDHISKYLKNYESAEQNMKSTEKFEKSQGNKFIILALIYTKCQKKRLLLIYNR